MAAVAHLALLGVKVQEPAFWGYTKEKAVRLAKRAYQRTAFYNCLKVRACGLRAIKDLQTGKGNRKGSMDGAGRSEQG